MPLFPRNRAPVWYAYEPRPDGTAYELARLLHVPLGIGRHGPLDAHTDGNDWGARIERLPDDLRRHFSPTRQAAWDR